MVKKTKRIKGKIPHLLPYHILADSSHITDIKKRLMTLHNIFTQNTRKIELSVMSHTFFKKRNGVLGPKKNSKIDYELFFSANLTKHID